jgi:hypothetical protein
MEQRLSICASSGWNMVTMWSFDTGALLQWWWLISFQAVNKKYRGMRDKGIRTVGDISVFVWGFFSSTNRNVSMTINSMKQSSSWEAISHSASQEIPLLLWNRKAYYRVHSSPPLVPILIHMSPVHIYRTHFLNILSNIILPPTPRPSKVVSSIQVFQPKYCMHFSSPPCVLHAPPISSSLTSSP